MVMGFSESQIPITVVDKITEDSLENPRTSHGGQMVEWLALHANHVGLQITRSQSQVFDFCFGFLFISFLFYFFLRACLWFDLID